MVNYVASNNTEKEIVFTSSDKDEDRVVFVEDEKRRKEFRNLILDCIKSSRYNNEEVVIYPVADISFIDSQGEEQEIDCAYCVEHVNSEKFDYNLDIEFRKRSLNGYRVITFPSSKIVALVKNSKEDDESESKLLTWEEYKKVHEATVRTVEGIANLTSHMSEPKFKCPDCGGAVRKDESIVLTSIPPQYQYVCDNCKRVFHFYY